ncbi:class I SAM-dependent methyltransferase [Kineosporia sp. J2-2]|uniref:Class I SAM-dependent methyltransferase n=1 Tax=Kineosporia corallincola TaxID=2835133 RepID=A0ABS5TQM9_9ACTN|nr:mycofactocin oligosaccharide methyltransferase MftM [Kineosporia corallincola]MBT0772784.1 class I SAM-dependent methyltransferase [Kineosporia corallincola]
MSETLRTVSGPPPIDPFAPAPGGCYTDGVVTVARRDSLRGLDAEQWTTTGSFAIGRASGHLAVLHALPDASIDRDVLTGLLRRELGPGWIHGADGFERILTGVVLSCRPDPMEAWELFYRNTLRGLGEPGTDGLAAVYRHAEELLAGSVSASLLDLGSSFGFFPLRVRSGSLGRPVQVLASDLLPGAGARLGRVSARLGLSLPVLCCDAGAVPLPDRSVDTVTLLHLLEHLDEAHGDRVLAEALRLARRQVIVAVPPEAGPVRTLGLAGLREAGARACPPGGRFRVHEHAGGWLVFSTSP